MSTEPTIQGLKKLLKRNNLDKIAATLEENGDYFEDWKMVPREDWERAAGEKVEICFQLL